MKLAALTCTGGRPEAWRLCCEWMHRQTVQPWQWVVVDDCEPWSPMPVGVDAVHPQPAWRGRPTLTRNLLAGLAVVHPDAEAVAIIEDDDWYGPGYIADVIQRLEEMPHAAMIGETCCRYYHVGRRSYAQLSNRHHSSLFQTAFRTQHMGDVRRIISKGDTNYIDIPLWRDLGGALQFRRGHSVGIKGMPGRGGLGNGHRNACREPDPGLDVLREWVGNDAGHYIRFGEAK